MGKTISLVHLWKYILEKYNRAVVYIQLSRVNEKSDIDNFLNEAILDIAFQNSFLSTYSRHTQLEILEQILKDKVSSKQRIVLLLDGFNEIHPSKRFSIKAQIEHLFSLSGVLIILTTRPDLEFELPITKIAKCKILPLKEYRIDSLLNKYNSSCLNPILRNLLSNVLMITLFIRICEWTNIGGQNTLSLLSINSESELIENFIEALLIKNYYERKHHTDQLVMTFSMKYLIPYIGYQMIKREEYKIHDRYQLKLMIEEFQSFALEGEDPFYEMKIQHLLLEYLHEWKMMFEIKFSDNISNEIINKSLLIQPAEDGGYRFWHQNFRDFMASKFIFNELNRTLTNGRISPLLIFEWNANLLRYLQELIVSSNQSISNYVNSLLETLSNSAQNESIFIANLFRLALVNNEVLANLKVKNLDLRQLSLHGTVLKSNVIQNCKINWNIFEPNHNNSIYIIPQNTRSRVIKTNRCNRILYSQNRDRIYLLVSFGIYKIDNIWLDDFVGKRLITTDIGNLIYCQTNNEEDRFLITTNGSLIVSSTKENEKCKIVQNQHYFTDDNRDYTNDILKAIFTQNDSEIVLQRENKKLEIVYIDNNYDKGFVDMDVYRQKIESCISLDNRWFARVQGDELCITDSICKISKLFFLDSFEECLLPVKFDVDCETLLLVDKVNQNYILLDLINGELKDNIKFYEQQGISIVEYSVCGKYLVFVHGDSSIRIYSINEKKTIYDYLYQSFSVVGVALSNGAKRLVVLDSNSRISVICIFTHKIIFSGEVQDISFIDTSLFDCDFTSAGTDKIKNHLMLHGADLS